MSVKGSKKKFLVIILAIVIGLSVISVGAIIALNNNGVNEHQATPTPTSGTTNAPTTSPSNLPDYDSGWVDITNKAGLNFTLSHYLNTTNTLIDIEGKNALNGESHKKYLGLISNQGWIKTYYGGEALGGAKTSDGGYVIIGDIGGINSPNLDDVNLIKTDSLGNMIWNKTYGTSASETPYAVILANDGGFAITGNYWANSNGKVFLYKTDANGNLVWNKTYGSNNNMASSIIQTNDGGYAIFGRCGPVTVNVDFYLARTDANGTLLWEKTFGSTIYDRGYSIIQSSDGGFIVAGGAGKLGGSSDLYLAKTDVNGNLLWDRTFGGSGDDNGYCIISTKDGGYVITGDSWEANMSRQVYLVKADSNGNMLWNKTYGGAQDDVGVSLIQVSDDGFVITGYTSSFGAGLTDVLLIKTDSDGRLQWQKTYGGSNYDRGANVFQTSDGGFVIVTDMLSYVIGRYGLIKTDTEFGIAQIASGNNTLTFYRGETDTYWNYIHVRVWKLE